jgi:hypothetical protein
VKEFIINFKLPIQRLSDTSAKLPLRFLVDFLEKQENQNIQWDVSLVTGGEKETTEILGTEWQKVKRTVEKAKDDKSIKLPKNQLSIPSHEFRFLNGTYTEMTNRTIARENRIAETGKPLLLLFPIKPEEAPGEDLDLKTFEKTPLWGWSISMPGSKNSEEHVSVLANSVFIKELMEDYEDIMSDEDN